MCKIYKTVLVLACLILAVTADLEKSNDRRKNAKEIIQGHGYSFEEHQVLTSDGYILTVFRIPSGKGKTGF